MKNISKGAYLFGLPVLVGAFVLYFMNVVIGDLSISIPSFINLHRPELQSLHLGLTGIDASVSLDRENIKLDLSNGLVMGHNNEAGESARYVSIGGGLDNSIASVERSGIGGGSGNKIYSSSSVIGGGKDNIIAVDGENVNAIAGGSSNSTQSGGTIVGGESNQVIGESVVVGGQNNQINGDGGIALGSNSQGGARSFSWNSPIIKDYSAIIMAESGVLIGTYNPVMGVNLVVDGAVKIGTGNLTGKIGEIRIQSGCFYGYDGSAWHVINKRPGDGCPNTGCAFGSILLHPGDSIQAYTQPYSLNCSQNFQTVYCNVDGHLGNGGEYYSYCYELSGGTWSAEEKSQCGSANGGAYVSIPVMSSLLCSSGTHSAIDIQDTLYTWTCTTGSSVESCSATRVYACSGDQPMGPGVIMGDDTHVYASSVSSWTPIVQGVSPGACQWTCDAGYTQTSNGCEYVGGNCSDYGTITICNPNDSSECLTMMDRNLGACVAGTGEESNGNYYQWGNNYGFPFMGDFNISPTQVNASGYGPDNYYFSNTFVLSPINSDWSSVRNDNLWGNTSGTNVARRGPCPSGYHVPSKGEWTKLLRFWEEENRLNKSESVTNRDMRIKFQNEFKIPFAGFYSDIDGTLRDLDKIAVFWTSSPSGYMSWHFSVSADVVTKTTTNTVRIDTDHYRGRAESIRCFKDVPDVPTNNLNSLDFNDLELYFLTNAGATGYVALMDRNLGATATGAGTNASIDSYGYFYQWGNNYGFPNQGIVNTSTERVNASGYGPENYYTNSTFVLLPNLSLGRLDWSSVRNDNLWGDTSGTNIARRGPCPSEYHVPTKMEYENAYNKWIGSTNYITDLAEKRAGDFLMPIAGFRDFASSNSQILGDPASYYWTSSSWNSDAQSYYLWLVYGSLGVDHGARAYGYSVRCFKNTQTSSMTIHPNGGTGALIIVHDGKITKLGTPTKAGFSFGGWFSNQALTSPVTEGSAVPSSKKLYAKWEGSTQCGSNGYANGEITICNPENCSECLTIMDRNLGASKTGTTCSTSNSGACGYHYQWGNNYGFPRSANASSILTSQGLTWNTTYNNHGYYSTMFINGNNFDSDVWSDSSHHDGVWGGGSDSASNQRGVISNNPSSRQGPCPDGYHVPSAGEWGLLIKYWRDTYATGGSLGGGNSLYAFYGSQMTNFQAFFMLPLADHRNRQAVLDTGPKPYGEYWTSSPAGDDGRYARYFYMATLGHVRVDMTQYRSFGNSIRCFKNN